ADRQGGVQRDARLGRHASPTARRRALDVRSEGRELACVGFARKPAPALLQSVEIATGYGLELPAQGLQLRIRCIVRAGMFHRAANDTGPTKGGQSHFSPGAPAPPTFLPAKSDSDPLSRRQASGVNDAGAPQVEPWVRHGYLMPSCSRYVPYLAGL